jgi:UDP-2,3-diacylglucosamine pyrophosphatase LpxH
LLFLVESCSGQQPPTVRVWLDQQKLPDPALTSLAAEVLRRALSHNPLAEIEKRDQLVFELQQDPYWLINLPCITHPRHTLAHALTASRGQVVVSGRLEPDEARALAAEIAASKFLPDDSALRIRVEIQPAAIIVHGPDLPRKTTLALRRLVEDFLSTWVFSDLHLAKGGSGNSITPAKEAELCRLLDQAIRERSRVIFNGDLLEGWGNNTLSEILAAHPEIFLRLKKIRRAICIAGNHDEGLLNHPDFLRDWSEAGLGSIPWVSQYYDPYAALYFEHGHAGLKGSRHLVPFLFALGWFGERGFSFFKPWFRRMLHPFLFTNWRLRNRLMALAKVLSWYEKKHDPDPLVVGILMGHTHQPHAVDQGVINLSLRFFGACFANSGSWSHSFFSPGSECIRIGPVSNDPKRIQLLWEGSLYLPQASEEKTIRHWCGPLLIGRDLAAGFLIAATQNLPACVRHLPHRPWFFPLLGLTALIGGWITAYHLLAGGGGLLSIAFMGLVQSPMDLAAAQLPKQTDTPNAPVLDLQARHWPLARGLEVFKNAETFSALLWRSYRGKAYIFTPDPKWPRGLRFKVTPLSAQNTYTKRQQRDLHALLYGIKDKYAFVLHPTEVAGAGQFSAEIILRSEIPLLKMVDEKTLQPAQMIDLDNKIVLGSGCTIQGLRDIGMVWLQSREFWSHLPWQRLIIDLLQKNRIPFHLIVWHSPDGNTQELFFPVIRPNQDFINAINQSPDAEGILRSFAADSIVDFAPLFPYVEETRRLQTEIGRALVRFVPGNPLYGVITELLPAAGLVLKAGEIMEVIQFFRLVAKRTVIPRIAQSQRAPVVPELPTVLAAVLLPGMVSVGFGSLLGVLAWTLVLVITVAGLLLYFERQSPPSRHHRILSASRCA